MRDKADTLTFPSNTKPDLVNIDGDKVLLTQKTDGKSLDEYVFQYFNAPLFLDRFEAITVAAANQSDKGAQKVMIAALKDKYYELQIKAIKALDMTTDAIRDAALPVLVSLAHNDVNTLVRAAAITSLGDLKLAGNTDLFKQGLNSQSYAVAGASLTALSKLNATESVKLARNIEKDSEGALAQAIMTVYAANGNSDQWPFMLQTFQQANSRAKFGLMDKFGGFTGRVDNSADAQQGIAELEKLGKSSKRLSHRVLDILNTIKEKREKMNDNASAQAADNAIKAIKG